MTVDGAAAGSLPGASINGVENFLIREVGGTAGVYDFSSVTGEQQVWSDRSSDAVTFSNVGTSSTAGTAATVGLKGDGAAVLGNVSFSTANLADKVSIAIDGGVGPAGTAAPTITNTGAQTATSATISSTGAANRVGVIDLGTGTVLTALTVDAATNLSATLDAGDYVAAGADLKVSGAAASVDLGTAGVFKTIDASGLSNGGLTVGLNAVTTSFKGGAGNDVVTTAGLTSAAASSIDAGAGAADRLVVAAAADVDTAAEAGRYAGFEVVEASAGTVDLGLFTNSTINGLRVTGSATFDRVSAAQAANVTVAANAAATFNVVGAATPGQIDTLSLTVNDGAAAVNTITLANITAAGVENLDINAVDNVVVSSLTGAGALNDLDVTGSATVNITTGGIALAPNGTVDASALTKAFTFDASLATGNGLAITGSTTAANTITGTNQADAIVGGTGVDTITNSGGNDTINFGVDSAADVFNIAVLTGKSTITNFDAGTATTTEDLVNVSNDAVDGAEVVYTAAGGQVALTNDATIIVTQTVGANGSLTTGGTQALTAADFTAATLTNVAAFLSEKFTTAANDQALVFLNDGTNTYAYHVNEGAADAGIQAGEVSLVGVFNGAVLNAGDINQTV